MLSSKSRQKIPAADEIYTTCILVHPNNKVRQSTRIHKLECVVCHVENVVRISLHALEVVLL